MQEAKPNLAMNQGVLAVVKFLYSTLSLSELLATFSVVTSEYSLCRILPIYQAKTVPSVPAEKRIFFRGT